MVSPAPKGGTGLVIKDAGGLGQVKLLGKPQIITHESAGCDHSVLQKEVRTAPLAEESPKRWEQVEKGVGDTDNACHCGTRLPGRCGAGAGDRD